MLHELPDYRDLDSSGEARAAAARMDARARERASHELFEVLVRPLLSPPPRRVLEVGCGTAALARRIARAAPAAEVLASDKSEGMLTAAKRHLEAESARIVLARWDVLDEPAFPFGDEPFNLIVSSVMVPYLDDAHTYELVPRLAARLPPGGVLAFIEQDLASASLHHPSKELVRRVMGSGGVDSKQTLALGLRPVLRAAGLTLLPCASFLWVDDAYGAYCRDLFQRFADAAFEAERISAEERHTFLSTLEALAADQEFYYGIVYHRVAGRKA
ncbi:MAG: class I SAM-dependent methyltransferase [Myxococcota bacterium]